MAAAGVDTPRLPRPTSRSRFSTAYWRGDSPPADQPPCPGGEGAEESGGLTDMGCSDEVLRLAWLKYLSTRR